MPKVTFTVVDATTRGPVATILMDFEMLKNEEVIDHDQMLLKGAPLGHQYTLIPRDDVRTATLKNLREAFLNVTEKPSYMFSTHIDRVDRLIKSVSKLFNEVELIEIRNHEDLLAIINPKTSIDYEYKIVKFSVLGELMEDILKHDQVVLEEWKAEAEANILEHRRS